MGANSSKASEGSSSSPSLEDLKSGVSGKDAVRQQPLHKGPIHCVCSVGETTIASGGCDKEAVVLNWRERQVEARLTGPGKDITKVCCNRKGSLVYAACRDRCIYAWKWPCSEPGATTLEGHSLGVSALDTSEGYPQLLCSGSRDNSVCLWDVDVGKPVSSMYVPRNLVTDLAWIPQQMAVAQASEDKSVRVWDLTSCSTVQHFKARNQLQLCCAVSEDQQYILSGGSGCGPVGGQLSLWDRRNEKRPLLETHAHHDGVYGCMFMATPTKALACSVGGDSSLRVWEQESLLEVCHGQLSDAGAITGLVAAQQDLLVSSSYSSGLSFWTLSGKQESLEVEVTFSCF